MQSEFGAMVFPIDNEKQGCGSERLTAALGC
jgi:hypothetical protein